MTEDAAFHSLTGLWAEGRTEIAAALHAEFAGLCAHVRLVSGRGRLIPLGPATCILHQHYVLTGLVDAAGLELPRVGAMLTAVLVERPGGWQALTATFAAVEG